MIIVVEGPDGVGKTTMCEMMVDYAQKIGYEARVSHHGPSPHDAMVRYVTEIEEHDPESLLVMDRFHYGDAVYGTTRRAGQTNLSLNDLIEIDDRIDFYGGQVVVVIPPLDDTIKRLNEKKEAVPDRIASERSMFELLAVLMKSDKWDLVEIYQKLLDRKTVIDVVQYTVNRVIERSGNGNSYKRHAVWLPERPERGDGARTGIVAQEPYD